MDCSLPGSSIHGIFQARVLEWVPLPSPHTDMRGIQNQMTMRNDQDRWFIASLRELLCSQPPDSSAFSWRAAPLHVGEGKKLIPVMPRRMNHSYHRGGKPNKRGQSHLNFTLEATSMVSAPCRREWGTPNSLEEKESWEAGTPASWGASSPLGVSVMGGMWVGVGTGSGSVLCVVWALVRTHLGRCSWGLGTWNPRLTSDSRRQELVWQETGMSNFCCPGAKSWGIWSPAPPGEPG